jgi:protocatechuate 3,4-dioxygenase beta subunit
MGGRWPTVLVILSLASPLVGSQDLQEIRPVLRPLSSGTGVISGLVVTDTGAPAAGATISINAPEIWSPNYESPPSQSRTTVADTRGRFTFDGVPDEAIELSASMPGFLDTVYGQVRPGLPGTPIRLGPNERLAVTLRLSRGSTISGMMFDPQGNPASGINVWAFRLQPIGGDEKLMGPDSGSAVSDDHGEYRIADLRAGTYVISAHRKRPLLQLAPIERIGADDFAVESGVFFPNAPDADSAEQLELRPGETRSGISMRLRMVPITTISGRVRDIDGRPAPRAHVQLIEHDTPPPMTWDIDTGPNGEFSLPRVPAGHYDVVAFSRSTEGPHHGRTPVTSDGRTPAHIVVDLRPAATISGRVVFAGRSAPPTTPRAFGLSLSGPRGDVPGTVGSVASTEFTYRGVPPGEYVIRINRETMPAGWHMQSEMVDGRNALDFPFEITADEHREVAMTLSDQMAELSGIVTNAIGAPVSDATVVVFAADERFWTTGSRRVVAVRPDTHGRYLIRGLPAGDYLIAPASPDFYGVPPPSLLRALKTGAEPFSLRNGERRTRNVRVRATASGSPSLVPFPDDPGPT